MDLFTPQLVQSYSQIKNSDLNANLLLIQDALNALSSYGITTGSYVFSPNQRNVLVDLSSVEANGDFITVTLPANPVIGDPPIKVCVNRGGLSVDGLRYGSCVINTNDGSNIMGWPGAVSTGWPFLSNTGDSMTLSFIGGSWGWSVVDSNVGAFAPPAGIVAVQQWDSFFLHGFHELDTVIDSTNITNTQINLDGINRPGLWCSFTLTAGVDLVTSSGAQKFNGIVGAYTIDIATKVGLRVLFTCLQTDTFMVTM